MENLIEDRSVLPAPKPWSIWVLQAYLVLLVLAALGVTAVGLGLRIGQPDPAPLWPPLRVLYLYLMTRSWILPVLVGLALATTMLGLVGIWGLQQGRSRQLHLAWALAALVVVVLMCGALLIWRVEGRFFWRSAYAQAYLALVAPAFLASGLAVVLGWNKGAKRWCQRVTPRGKE